MNVPELCFRLRNRRRMYLLDDRYVTAVAFIDGFNAALDGVPLDGFDEWVSERILGRRSSSHWAYVVAAVRVPSVFDPQMGIGGIPSEFNLDLVEDAIHLIEEFHSRLET